MDQTPDHRGTGQPGGHRRVLLADPPAARASDADLDGDADGAPAGGLVFLAFHIGSEVLHLEEWWGHAVMIDFIFFEIEEMKTWLTQVGYELEWVIERAPYAGVEHPSQRAYILARRPE